MALLVLVTLAVAASAVFLLVLAVDRRRVAARLLRDGLLLWTSNVLTFAMWYWEVDGGGPTHRCYIAPRRDTDFAFPPQQAKPPPGRKTWSGHRR